MAAFTREKLGEDRLAWLRGLATAHIEEDVALIHATPGSRWKSPFAQASDEELAEAYAELPGRTVVYGHVHTPFVRRVAGRYIANSGSVGQPHDGDRRAGYLMLDDGVPSIRRVEYDVDRELKVLAASGLPHANWVARILETARPQMP
jgi:hypothetical protein